MIKIVMQNPQVPPSSIPDRPLDPPPSGRVWARWFFILFAVNIMGLIWLAVRSESGEKMGSIQDSMVQIGIACVVAFGAFRALTLFPFRITDLLAIVVLLGMGIGVALEMLKGVSKSSLGSGHDLNPQSNLPLAVQTVLFALSLLILGAAIGLRYCHRLKFESALIRIGAIVYGMFFLPSLAGVFAFPALFLLELNFKSGLVQDKGNGSRYLILWAFSLMFAAKNGVLLMRSLALQSAVRDSSGPTKPV